MLSVVGHLYVFGKMSTQVLLPLFRWKFFFFLLLSTPTLESWTNYSLLFVTVLWPGIISLQKRTVQFCLFLNFVLVESYLCLSLWPFLASVLSCWELFMWSTTVVVGTPWEYAMVGIWDGCGDALGHAKEIFSHPESAKRFSHKMILMYWIFFAWIHA